ALQPGANVLTVTARDAANNTATATLTVTLTDTSPPAVALTAPMDGAMVTGATTIMATATANVGVAGAQCKLEGANVGTEVTSAPYSVPLNTTTATNGSHTLTAVARDAAGNSTTSTAVIVTVSNDTTPPTVTITTPTANLMYTTSSAVLTVGGTAADNVRVTQVTWTNSRGGSGTATGTTSWTASGIALQLRSEEHTSEVQSDLNNACSLLVT